MPGARSALRRGGRREVPRAGDEGLAPDTRPAQDLRPAPDTRPAQDPGGSIGVGAGSEHLRETDPGSGAEDHADGRVMRGIRNREAVVEAFISLIETGEARPTARAIAARAGLSLRSVFAHFDDLEQIYEAAGRRVLRRLLPLLDPVPADQPLDARIDELLDRRVPLLEQLDPVARAARLREPFSEQLQSNRAAVVRLMRDQCEGSFAPELETSPEPLLTAITTSCSWSTWYHLRNDQQLSSAEATDVVRLMLRSVLRGGVGIDVRPEAAVGST